LQAWRAFATGRSGLIHSPTGTGKTLAAWMGLIEDEAARAGLSPASSASAAPAGKSAVVAPNASNMPRTPDAPGLRALWLTPLRALATDTAGSLQSACDGVGLKWKVELRTGDTAGSVKSRQREKPPRAMVTTPESLSVMLSYAGAREMLSGVRLVVVDEWHELLGSKRGVQTELALSRLRAWNPGLVVFGVSATLGNIERAAEALLGVPVAGDRSGTSAPSPALLIRGVSEKRYEFHTLLPANVERFPWAGHLGLRQLEAVIGAIESANTSLLFCNTRGQAEIWYQSLLKARPEWLRLGAMALSETGNTAPDADRADVASPSDSRAQRSAPDDSSSPDGVLPLALHHGSVDRDLRQRIEAMIKAGRVRCVVCTSSLDLGVDFPPVDQVIQIGSPKGVGRLLQRAGRSGHQPGKVSRVVCVPTNTLEIIEFAAAREAVALGQIESREPIRLALDVLCQHVVTCASGGGFVERDLLNEVRSTWCFANISDEQWRSVMDFSISGGATLRAYDRFARIALKDGRWVVASDTVARQHRLGIGTIVSESAILVRFERGATLGTVEEGFLSKMKPGDVFVFAGRRLELIRLREMTATVRPAKKSGVMSSWQGARMALSAQLADRVRERFAEGARGELRGPEMRCAGPLLELQSLWSALPTPQTLVIEEVSTRDGHHAFIYPLEGRLVHEGLAALVAFRLARISPRTVIIAANDYGFELVSTTPIDLDEHAWRSLLSPENLSDDLIACINASQIARRHFREIARVAGLLVAQLPGSKARTGRGPSARHMQASSELFFDVFEEFDPGNMLLLQARREAMDNQLEYVRLQRALDRIRDWSVSVQRPGRLTPLAFPLWADSMRQQLSTESWEDRVQRMLKQLEADAQRSTLRS
jgi:ATP-dependent Lhr-like helicase